MFGYGMQTWEYSAEFALRSWWYILLHALIGRPFAYLFGPNKGKIIVMYAIKMVLALFSAFSEWYLYLQVRARYGRTTHISFLLLLGCSSGLFVSTSAFLPSSFTMIWMTLAAGGFLAKKPSLVIAAAVVGSVWGWIVASLAFLPYALWVLFCVKSLARSFTTLAACMLVSIAPVVITDRVFYGTWNSSLWNFIVYNVLGGGHSALYGVEGPTYYLRNGFNQLQFALPFALLMPVLAVLQTLAFSTQKPPTMSSKDSTPRGSSAGSRHEGGRRPDAALLACISPSFLWLVAISMLPHKEERFLYVVYPLLCLGAAASLDICYHAARKIFGSRISRAATILVLLSMSALSCSRSMALVLHYGAPMAVYVSLPEDTSLDGSNQNRTYVCVGAEWHRFPSSFFLPGPRYRLKFLKSSFDGLLPREFDPIGGGTRASPPELNQWNREEPSNYWRDANECQYVVTMSESSLERRRWADGDVLGDPHRWRVVREETFLNGAESPSLTRAFYFPFITSKRNRWLSYVLLARQHTQTHNYERDM